MSLLQQALASLRAKEAEVKLCPDLPAAAAVIREAVPSGEPVAVHSASVPAPLLPLIADLRPTEPARLAEGAREAVMRAHFGITGGDRCGSGYWIGGPG